MPCWWCSNFVWSFKLNQVLSFFPVYVTCVFIYDLEEDHVIFSVVILQECFLYLLGKEGSEDVVFVQFLTLLYYFTAISVDDF